MKYRHFYLTYVLIMLVQMIVCNFIYIPPFITLTTLPILIMMLPIETGTIKAMVIAFVTALALDLLSDGLLGLNCLALVPVALLRRPLISLVFGREVFARNENIPDFSRSAFSFSVGSILCLSLFLAIYILADGAGTRPFWFNLTRFVASLVADYVVAIIVSIAFNSTANSSRWN